MTEITTNEVTLSEARQLTEEIRFTAKGFAETKTKLLDLVQEAKDGNVHEVLGYASWTAYLSQTLGEEPLRLARDDRQEMVAMLSAEGMSTRAIAPIVGASDWTVRNDQNAGARNLAPDSPTVSHGMDGKSYERKPAKPKRTPLPKQFDSAILKMIQTAKRFRQLQDDDRFDNHVEDFSAMHKSDVQRAIADLQNLLNRMENAS